MPNHNKSLSIIIKISLYFILILGVLLTSINIYGLFQQLEPKEFFLDELRFKKSPSLTYKETAHAINKLEGKSDEEIITELTNIIPRRLAHIHWEKYNPIKFNQTIPIWENYFIYILSVVTDIPEYKRYHFANYKKSLNRGIGICGDASMIMTQILEKNKIESSIISFPGHVLTSIKLTNNTNVVADPDFGVYLPFSIDTIHKKPNIIRPYYLEKGYSINEIESLERAYKLDYQTWNGVKHFITNKYYYEEITYIFKWPFPLLLILISLVKLKSRKTSQITN